MSGVSKSVEEQVKAASGAAEDALEAGISRVSAAVRAGVAAVSAEGAAAKARVAQFYGTGLAHYQATEAQAVELVKQGVRYVSVDHPQASLAASAAAAAILLPGPRRFLFRQTIGRCAHSWDSGAVERTPGGAALAVAEAPAGVCMDACRMNLCVRPRLHSISAPSTHQHTHHTHTPCRFRSEEAVFRSAELRYGALRERVEGQSSDLHRLQARGRGRGEPVGREPGPCTTHCLRAKPPPCPGGPAPRAAGGAAGRRS